MRYPPRLPQMIKKSLTQFQIRSAANDIINIARKDHFSPPNVLVSKHALVRHQPLKTSILDFHLSVHVFVCQRNEVNTEEMM
jgi:hypothetical protein